MVFLDARAGNPIDHDRILSRVIAETPAGALARLGWRLDDLFGEDDGERHALRVSLAQYRYEEGRTLFLEYGVRCKSWGHPDHPPVGVRDFILTRLKELNAQPEANHGHSSTAEQT